MAQYLLPALETIAGVAMLIVSSFVLTSTIEDLGKRRKFSDSFTGSVISPIFTAMPELIIIIIALVAIGNKSGSEIAAGTIIGEPFMVSAIGFPIMAIALLLSPWKKSRESLDPVLPMSLIFIGLVFPIMLIPRFFNFVAVRVAVAISLVLLYVLFLHLIRGKESTEEALNIRIGGSGTLVMMLVVGVALLLVGSTALVRGIDSLSNAINVNRELITILIVPIGTIVPETMNSVVWASKGKANLAVGALTGEEIFFVTFFPALGILASQWVVTTNGILAISLTSIFSILMGLIIYEFRRTLYLFFLFVIPFIVFILFIY